MRKRIITIVLAFMITLNGCFIPIQVANANPLIFLGVPVYEFLIGIGAVGVAGYTAKKYGGSVFKDSYRNFKNVDEMSKLVNKHLGYIAQYYYYKLVNGVDAKLQELEDALTSSQIAEIEADVTRTLDEEIPSSPYAETFDKYGLDGFVASCVQEVRNPTPSPRIISKETLEKIWNCKPTTINGNETHINVGTNNINFLSKLATYSTHKVGFYDGKFYKDILFKVSKSSYYLKLTLLFEPTFEIMSLGNSRKQVLELRTYDGTSLKDTERIYGDRSLSSDAFKEKLTSLLYIGALFADTDFSEFDGMPFEDLIDLSFEGVLDTAPPVEETDIPLPLTSDMVGNILANPSLDYSQDLYDTYTKGIPVSVPITESPDGDIILEDGTVIPKDGSPSIPSEGNPAIPSNPPLDLSQIWGGELNVNADAFKNTFNDKLNTGPLNNSINKLLSMNTEKGKAPVFYVNLYKFFETSTKHFGSPKNPFEDKEIVFLDFGVLDPYIDYFRTLISVGFYITTYFYIRRKIYPDKVVG